MCQAIKLNQRFITSKLIYYFLFDISKFATLDKIKVYLKNLRNRAISSNFIFPFETI